MRLVNTTLRCVETLIFVIPALIAATMPSSGTVQDKGNGDRSLDGGDEAGVQDRVARGHGVGGTDRDGEQVDGRVGDKLGGVLGLRARLGVVDAVLSADLPELGLDAHPRGVSHLDHLRGRGAVDVVG